ncbi:MAG: hypothetical protein J0H86_20045 [Xanthomonadaceae bacterium]|nr:hypothetical protein [Xanthomonadaceae bacterium]
MIERPAVERPRRERSRMSSSSSRPPTTPHDRLLPFIGVTNVLAVAVAALVFVPKFRLLFDGFGSDLPQATLLVLATYRGWGLAALLVPAVWLLWPDRQARAVAALLVGIATALALTGFGLWACYSPIFMLAERVG